MIEVRDRMLEAMPADIDTTEGSFPFDLLTAVAIELGGVAYVRVEDVLRLGFAQTTEGIYLERKAREHGLDRLGAVPAVGEVVFTGVDGTSIPAGTLVATGNGRRYTTDTGVVIVGGTATATITAESGGAGGNVPAGQVVSLPVSIAGVSGVSNPVAAVGGTDTESDEALRARLLAAVRDPATSGNEYHYRQWAGAVDGVGRVKVEPLWDGPGTVRVWIADAEGLPVGEGTEDAVAAYIEARRPVGAAVTVASAEAVTIDVSVTLETNLDLTLAKSRISEALAVYLASISFEAKPVRYTRVGDTIIDIEGIDDYEALEVNSGTGNIAIGLGQTPVLGTVVVT